MKEKTYVEDIDRNIYDFKYDDKDAYKLKAGLTPEIVEQLSKEKHDPAWMQNFRLESLQIYNNMQVPDWGPSIEGLDIDNIVTYVRPNTKMKGSWDEVPEDIKDTFERLGIPCGSWRTVRLRARISQCPPGGCGYGSCVH